MHPGMHEIENPNCHTPALWYKHRSVPVFPGRPNQFTRHPIMSQHRSLRAAAGTTGAKRNVLKRFERVALLKNRGQWKDGERVTGLRKTKPPE